MKNPLLFVPVMLAASAVGNESSAQIVGGGWEANFQIEGSVGLIGFGWSIVKNGDMNGDGIADMLIGAPGKGGGAGAIYLHDGATGDEIWLINGENQGDRLGLEMTTLDDLDGDGINEFMASAPGYDPNGMSYAGRLYIFNGASPTSFDVIEGEAANDNFGDGLEVLPDMDGDGYNDIAVTADVGDDGILTDRGIVYIFSGKTRTELARYYGPQENSRFGCEVAAIGDITGDGITELLIGAKGTEIDFGGGAGLETDVGRAFVLNGATGQTIHVVTGEVAFGYFGSSVAAAGDLDQDGVRDFLVASQEYTDPVNGTECGAVYAYSGATGWLLRKFIGENPEDKFGKSLAGDVDVNNDGRVDIIVGAHLKDLNNQPGSFAGGVYVFSGTGETLLNYNGAGFRERLGAEIEIMGDDDGDGFPEFYVAGPDYRPPGTQPRVGRLLLFEFDPFMTADTNVISSANGGTINFDINFREEQADQSYQVLFSRGNGPTVIDGVKLPLSPGTLFQRTQGGDYSFLASSTGMIGTLDAAAQATAQLSATTVPAGLIGQQVYIAAVTADSGGILTHSSVATAVTVEP